MNSRYLQTGGSHHIVSIGIDTSLDSQFSAIKIMMYLLKDLRNAVAHNSPIFDARFNSFTPKKYIGLILAKDTGIKGICFSELLDYLVLCEFLLKHLKESITKQKTFVRSFFLIFNRYCKTCSPEIACLLNPAKANEVEKNLLEYASKH